MTPKMSPETARDMERKVSARMSRSLLADGIWKIVGEALEELRRGTYEMRPCFMGRGDDSRYQHERDADQYIPFENAGVDEVRPQRTEICYDDIILGVRDVATSFSSFQSNLVGASECGRATI